MFNGFPQSGLGFGGGAAAPSAPTITAAASGNDVVITIAGDDAATNILVYKSASTSTWISGGSRSGDGDITVSDLDFDVPYVFVVYSQLASGAISAPSPALQVTLSETATALIDIAIIQQAQAQLTAFGESVTYYPAGGGSRGILAIIDRESVVGVNGASRGNTQFIIMTVANDSAIGISSSELDTGGDRIEFPKRIGDPVQKRGIRDFNNQDRGMMELEMK